jgi:hypothetical protein
MARPPKTSLSARAKLDDALGDLAVAVANAFFDDPEGTKAFRASQTPARLRKAAKSTKPSEALDFWELEEGGSVALLPTAEAKTLAFMAEHDDFRATVALYYDPDSDEPPSTRIVAFEGNAKNALKHARAWKVDFEEDGLGGELFDGVGTDSLSDLTDLAYSMRADRVLTPWPDAAKKLHGMASRAAARLRRKGACDLSNADMDFLRKYPGSLLLTLEGYVAACTAEPRDEELVSAWQPMLMSQLAFVQPEHEDGSDWAMELIQSYEARIIALAEAKTIAVGDWYVLPTTLVQARIAISEDAKIAFGEAGAALAPPAERGGDMPALMRIMIEKLSADAGDAFTLVSILQEVSGPLPADARAYMTHELALAPHAVARDAVPLLLLDRAPEVRQAAAAALEQIAMPETLSPDSLRRIIAVRNWIPTEERPAVDRAIRKAREKGVAIAPWPAGTAVATAATLIDGVSAQSLLAYSPSGRTGLLAMVLLKRAVRDTSCVTDEKRKEIKHNLEFLAQNAHGTAVARDYVDTAVQHAIASGLAEGIVPPAGLLQIAECICATDWKDRRLDVAAEIADLFGRLDAGDRSDARIAASLRRSNGWCHYEEVFGSWFEDVSDIPDLMAKAPKRKGAMTVQFVLDEVIEKLRGRWTENLLLLALWARAAKDVEIQTRWKDFLILAHCMSSGWKLGDIPLMRTAAETTLAMSPGRRH